MRLPYYEVAAFTAQPFAGNPAGVCPLAQWLPDALLQNIAAENNLSETAFVVPEGDGFRLRWFTPTVEVSLCGHATLATAFVLFTELGYGQSLVRFQTQSGLLEAKRRNDLIELDFPAWLPKSCPAPVDLVRGLKSEPREVLRSRDYLVVFGSQSEVAVLQPDMDLLTRLDCLGVIVTARGEAADFVSRFFAPGAGVPEDPVTGSAHSTLVPFWARRLGKSELVARQISKRGGTLYCRHRGERVAIAGRAVVCCRGEMKRRTLRQLRPKRQPQDHHHVYIVLLDPAVGRIRKVRAENPQRDPKKPCVYVGMTGLTPEERFANHKQGIKDAWVVKRYGIRLLPELYEHLNPMPFEAAAQMEKDLAEDLRRAGYTVTGGH